MTLHIRGLIVSPIKLNTRITTPSRFHFMSL